MSMIDYSRVAIVTGTSSGIGRATVFAMAERGFRVYALLRKPADIGSLDQEIVERNLSHAITTLQLDVTDAHGRERLRSEILDRESERLYDENPPELVLVNNAGFGLTRAFEEMSDADLRSIFETNFFGAVSMTREFLPVMRQLKRGRIIMVSSGFGLVAAPLLSAYCATKFALEGFSESLHYELIGHNVHVSLIEPGPVRTWFNQNSQDPEPPEDSHYAALYGRAVEVRDLGAKWASSPEDVARVVLDAACASSPRLRYPVGPAAHLAGAATFFPQTLIDGAFKLFT